MIVKMNAIKSSKRAIAYIMREDKATLRMTMNLNGAEDYSVQMERTERLWGKDRDNGRHAYHLKFCFNPRDDTRNGGSLTDQLAIKVVAGILKEFFHNHQAAIAVHNDTPNKHVHVVLGAVDVFTGRKLNLRNAEYRALKDKACQLAAEYGLTEFDWRAAVAHKRQGETQRELPVMYSFAEKGMQQRGKNSWKYELCNIIDEAVIGTMSMDTFREKLAKKNVTLTRCTPRTITYKYGNHKPVRGDTLGGDYTMAAIQDALKYYREWPNIPINKEDRQLYRTWGKLGGVKRSEIDAICDEIHQATWEQKKAVWAEYKQLKDAFWEDYEKRKNRLQKNIDEAYRRRRLVRKAEWLLSPYNRKRCLAGIIFAAIIRHQNGNRQQVEEEIQKLRGQQEQLREESRVFRGMSNEALQTLRKKGLALDDYQESVRQMQELAEGMFSQPTQEMAILWLLERRARVKEPTLEEYLMMCEFEQNEQKERENGKELLY